MWRISPRKGNGRGLLPSPMPSGSNMSVESGAALQETDTPSLLLRLLCAPVDCNARLAGNQLFPLSLAGLCTRSIQEWASNGAVGGAFKFLACFLGGGFYPISVCYNRQGRKANVGAGTATATEPTREHKQYATQGPTTYLCT